MALGSTYSGMALAMLASTSGGLSSGEPAKRVGESNLVNLVVKIFLWHAANSNVTLVGISKSGNESA